MEATIPELQAKLAASEVSSVELVRWYLNRVATYDQNGPALNALCAINPAAEVVAGQLDAERRQGVVRSMLHGIPVVVKDNFATCDLPTTAGSVLLQSWIPHTDATVVARLRAAGAIILAKANLHEFSYGYLCNGSAFGPVRSPYLLGASPGGSSGGSAVAATANFAAVALGTDTVGSIRLPAAMNSLVGLRPTPGLVSRTGIVPMSHTLDQAGPLGRTVVDVAHTFDIIVGYDAADPTTVQALTHQSPSYADVLDATALRGARLGVLTELFAATPGNPQVIRVCRACQRSAKFPTVVFN